jgi:hypothetical protein
MPGQKPSGPAVIRMTTNARSTIGYWDEAVLTSLGPGGIRGQRPPGALSQDRAG